MKTVLCLALSLLIVFNASAPVFAEDKAAGYADEPSGTEMAFDVIFLRPFGMASMAVGAGLFIVSLPFTIPTSTVGLAGRKFVAEPAGYTFARPVGELEYP